MTSGPIDKSINLLFVLILPAILWGCSHFSKTDDRETAELHMQIGLSFVQKENYPSALRELLTAEKIDPTNPLVQSNLGYVYYMRDHLDLAEKHYQRSIELKPDFTDAKNNLARLYIERGKLAAAVPLLKEALKDLTYNDYPKIYTNLGVLEFKRGRYSLSKVYFKKALEYNQDDCANRLYLGRSLLELRDLPTASLELNRSINSCRNLTSDDAYFYSAIALYRNNEREKSMMRFEEMLRLYPNGKNTRQAREMLEYIKKGTL